MATTFTPTLVATGTVELASASLAASGTTTTNVDVSAHMEKHIQVSDTGGGTVAATNGLQVQVFIRVGSGPTNDTVSSQTYTIITVVSTAALQSIKLGPGKYAIKTSNLDVTNAVTQSIVSDTYDLLGT